MKKTFQAAIIHSAKVAKTYSAFLYHNVFLKRPISCRSNPIHNAMLSVWDKFSYGHSI